MPATSEDPAATQSDDVGFGLHHTGEFEEPERFVNIENVAVFAEHETTTPDGRPLRFGYAELRAVCDRCNRRIAETGDYAGITVGHTPSPEAKSSGAMEPKLIGLAGPFKMGQIGNDGTRVRHAIFCDFHIFKSEAHEIPSHPRRSPELWIEDSYEEMFLDPIALLGAEAPRLDLGLLYSGVHHGRRKHKYSAVEASAFNAYTPGNNSRANYAGDSLMGSPEQTVAMVLDAFEKSDMGQWIRAKMVQDSAGGASGDTAAGATGAPNPADTAPVKPVATAADPYREEEDYAHKELYAAMDMVSDKDMEKYMSQRKMRCAKPYNADGDLIDDPINEADGELADDEQTPADASVGPTTEKYQRSKNLRGKLAGRDTQDRFTALERRLADSEKKLNYERMQRINSERIQTLQTLQMDGYPIDAEFEVIGDGKSPGRMHYSKLNDEQFDSQIEFIMEKMPRAPVDQVLPYDRAGHQFAKARPGSDPARDQVTAQQRETAMKYAKRMSSSANPISYKDALAKVKAGEVLA